MFKIKTKIGTVVRWQMTPWLFRAPIWKMGQETMILLFEVTA